jgi:uncharacterized sulfatase
MPLRNLPTLWGLLLTLGLGDNLASLAADVRPNVLFIAVDDLGNVLGERKPEGLRTPHLDKMISESVFFERAYCQIPLCNPSRASVLTGLRPDVTSVYDLDRHFRDQVPEAVTLPQLFRQHGWMTARVGKIFHYDVPKQIGTDGLDDKPSWDVVVNPQGRDVHDEALITNPTPQRPVSAALSWLQAEGTDEEQTDGLIASEAIKLLERHRDRALFLGVGFFRPHTPYVAPKKYFDLHPLSKVRLPISPGNDRDDIPPAAFAHNCPIPNYGLPESTCREALQAYFACVSFIDAQIGHILAALRRLDLEHNTIVIVWSDHGYHLGEHNGIWQKRCLFEESARTPLILRAPQANGNGRACKQIVEFVDIYPTVAELAGLPLPKNLSGRSLRPLFENPDRAWNGHAFTQILRPGAEQPFMGCSIRTDRWRFTEWDEGRAGTELYDHQHDPHEFTNLATDPSLEQTRKELRATLRSKLRGTVPTTPFKRERL